MLKSVYEIDVGTRTWQFVTLVHFFIFLYGEIYEKFSAFLVGLFALLFVLVV